MKETAMSSSLHSSNSPIKIVLLGDEGVGKTALLVRFLCRRYLGEYDPTIEDSYSKKVTVDGKTSIIEVLDTANKGLGTARREDFMSTSQAFVMVFSTTNRKTFDSIPKYKETMESYPGQCCAPVALIGTKSDLTHLRQVTRCDAQAIANANSWSYSECTAAYDLNIQSIFHNIIRRIRGDAEVSYLVNRTPDKNQNNITVMRKKSSLFDKISSQFHRKRSYNKNLQLPPKQQQQQQQQSLQASPTTQFLKTRLLRTATMSSESTSSALLRGRRKSYSFTTFI